MQSSKKEQKTLFRRRRAGCEKSLLQCCGFAAWADGSVRDDDAFEVVKGKALGGDALLFFAGKTDSFGEAQVLALREQPVGELLDVFQRIGAAEIGVQHAVDEDHIRPAPGNSLARGQSVICQTPFTITPSNR